MADPKHTPKPAPTPASTPSPEDIAAKNERLYALMDRMAEEAEAKKKKEAGAKAAVDRAAGGALQAGAKAGRSGLGKHTRSLLEQVED